MTQTDETVSKNNEPEGPPPRPALIEWMARGVTVASLLAVAVIFIAALLIGTLGYVTFRLRVTHGLEIEQVRQQEIIKGLEAEVRRGHEELTKSLYDLEYIVYEPVAQKPPPPATRTIVTTVPRLDRQIQEMRKELSSLQARFLQHLAREH